MRFEADVIATGAGQRIRIEDIMLPWKEWGDRPAARGPLVVMSHWLGGSAQTWTLLAERLAERGMRCVAVDLPGFGDAAELSDETGYSVRAMADAVIATVEELRMDERDTSWLLAGHSLGGKVSAVVAREALSGKAGLEGLHGVVLLSPSPPGPEPMKESKREQLLDTLGESTGNAAEDRRHAETFVAENAGEPPLGKHALGAAVDVVRQANKAALRAWLTSGSKEDWRGFVGELPLPALVFAGTEDTALGPDAQREHTLPFFTGGPEGGELVMLEGAGHLAPLERPGEVAERIVEFCAKLGLPVRRRVTVGERFSALLSSDLTSAQTRSVMQDRLAEDDAAYDPQAVGRQGLRVLREMARRIVPGAPFDLAARVDRELAHGLRDGWRPAELPEDCAAWRRGLASLAAASQNAYGISFVGLPDELQDQLLEQAAAGTLGDGLGERVLRVLGVGAAADDDLYRGAEMKLWFGDAHAELTRLYMADARTMERIGFSGFADDAGFTQIRLGEREVWER